MKIKKIDLNNLNDFTKRSLENIQYEKGKFGKRGDWKYKYTDKVIGFQFPNNIFENKIIQETFNIDADKSIIYLCGKFLWNGASGVKDTKYNIIPSMLHDLGYQLIRNKVIPYKFKGYFDKQFVDLCKLLGASSFTCWKYKIGLRLFGGIFGLGKWQIWKG